MAENDPYIADTKKYFGIDKYYDNIDMAETIKQYYNLFSNALSQSFPSDKTSFSEADINTMPSGYAIDGIQGRNFNDPNNRMNITHLRDFSEASITNIYKTSDQMKEAESLYIQSGASIDGLSGHSFGLSLEEIKNVSQGEDWQFKPDMSFYPKNEDGTYTREDLFMSFLKSYGSGQPVESLNTTLNPKVEAYNMAMAKESFNSDGISLDDIMTGKVDFASLLKYKLDRGYMAGELYMYEKGYISQASFRQLGFGR